MRAKPRFSKREREIMDIIYRHGQATAAEVMDELADPPSYSAVRATLRVLENKGHLRHIDDGTRYVYKPTVDRERASRTALRELMTTFFDDSAEKVVAALLETRSDELSADDYDRIRKLVDRARREGR